MVDIILASASKARLQVLRSAGLDPRVIVSDIDEAAFGKLIPYEHVLNLAIAKARAVAHKVSSGFVIGCDSVLTFENRTEFKGQPIGKPHSSEEAYTLWRAMAGRKGKFLTGHCLIDVESTRLVTEVNQAKVRLSKLNDAEIEAYIATGEPLQAAGGFAIDRLGGWFIESINGDYSNVVGLSLPTLRRLFCELDVDVVDLWRSHFG